MFKKKIGGEMKNMMSRGNYNLSSSALSFLETLASFLPVLRYI